MAFHNLLSFPAKLSFIGTGLAIFELLMSDQSILNMQTDRQTDRQYDGNMFMINMLPHHILILLLKCAPDIPTGARYSE